MIIIILMNNLTLNAFTLITECPFNNSCLTCPAAVLASNLLILVWLIFSSRTAPNSSSTFLLSDWSARWLSRSLIGGKFRAEAGLSTDFCFLACGWNLDGADLLEAVWTLGSAVWLWIHEGFGSVLVLWVFVGLCLLSVSAFRSDCHWESPHVGWLETLSASFSIWKSDLFVGGQSFCSARINLQ